MKQKRQQYEMATGRCYFFSDKLYWVAAVVGAAFLVLGTFFIVYAERRSKQDVMEHIRVSTGQVQYAVDRWVNEKFEMLSTESFFLEYLTLAEEALVETLAHSLHEDSTYVDVGFTDALGQAFWVGVDNVVHRGDLSDESFIQQALTGENVFTGRRKAFFSDQDVAFFAVPIDHTGVVTGVVFASLPVERLHTIIEHSLYAGQGLVHITDREGNYVFPSPSPLSIGIGNSIFDVSDRLSPELQQRMLADMAGGNTGTLETRHGREKRISAYAPLDVNGWYVFYAVPENLVHAGPKLVEYYAIAIIGIAGVLFVLFFFLIRQSNIKGLRELERLAFEDPVTGHGNYQKFLMDAEALVHNNEGRQYAVWYGDIANFKYINALFGREVGNRLLRHFTEFSTKDMPPYEAFARVSADVFVSLRVFVSEQQIWERCRRGAEAFAAFPETAASGYRVEQYGGIYTLNPQDGELSIEEMIDRANVAQKSVKGSNTPFALFSSDMREEKLWETQVESRMEAALLNEEFTLYLQPKMDIHKNCIMGAEALVRWISPTDGVISPGRFIPLFEKNGFIVKLDRHLFERACRHYWQTILNEGRQRLIFSVNVSRLGLLQPDFLDFYIGIKEKYAVPDSCIELEFTESLVFENDELFQSVVEELHRHGFLCSLDDFGAGYSSLNILKSLEVDVLKLDGLFFRYGDNAQRAFELVRNVISLAKAMGMKTVAEGIEDENQVWRLREMGCDAIQGYVFAKPMPLEEFREFADKWRCDWGEDASARDIQS